MNSVIRTILVPTDFSQLSACALKVAVAIAKRHHAEIIVLHVIDELHSLQPAEVLLPNIRITADIASTLKDLIDSFVEDLRNETGIKVSGQIKIGVPYDQICRFSNMNNISLIVMGTHGVSGFREFFIGSEASKVVKYSYCPVLTIPGNWDSTEFKKILFPVRIVPGAIEKYLFIRPIIEKNRAELIILGLQEKEKPDQISEVVLLTIELKIQLHNDNIAFESIICPSDNFSSTVIESAKKLEADLIVLTTDLDEDFRDFFKGTFGQQVINHSSLPVLSIKPTNKQNDPTLYLKLARNWRKSFKGKKL
jgi:nucleotide-binding universal stress UspA family protein